MVSKVEQLQSLSTKIGYPEVNLQEHDHAPNADTLKWQGTRAAAPEKFETPFLTQQLFSRKYFA